MKVYIQRRAAEDSWDLVIYQNGVVNAREISTETLVNLNGCGAIRLIGDILADMQENFTSPHPLYPMDERLYEE